MSVLTRPTLTKIAPLGVRDGTHRRYAIDSNGEVSLTRKFQIHATDQYKVAEYFLGKSRFVSADSRLRRLLPLTDDKDTTFVASGITVAKESKFLRPLGANPAIPGDRNTNPAPVTGGVDAEFYRAEIEVRYTRIQYRLLEDADCPADAEYNRFVQLLEPRPASSILTMPGHQFRFVRPTGTGTAVPHNTTIPFNLPRVFPAVEIPVIWYNIPSSEFQFSSPGAYLKRYLGDPTTTPPTPSFWGTINKYDFLGYSAHTLMLTDWRLVPRPSLVPESGYLTIDWDVHYTFLYDPNKHTFKYYNSVKPSTGSWTNTSGFYQVTADGTYYAPGSGTLPDNTSVANERDFSLLFKLT